MVTGCRDHAPEIRGCAEHKGGQVKTYLTKKYFHRCGANLWQYHLQSGLAFGLRMDLRAPRELGAFYHVSMMKQAASLRRD